MSDTTFTNGVTLTDSDWFNDLNRLHYTIFGDPTALADAFKTINNLTEDTSPSSANDFALTYDASASTAKKVKLSNLSGGVTLGTPAASTSGTSIVFTGISGAKRIVVSGRGCSTNGTSNLMMQLGTGGSMTTTGYKGGGGAATSSFSESSSGVIVSGALVAAQTFQFKFEWVLENSSTNAWVGSGQITINATNNYLGCGDVALSGTCDRVGITTSGGTDTFDAGEMNIQVYA